ncbi:GNAT family N-acetyltransferase [Maridesulfovibrio zosterae]|uniref:GNAT family N-acetyltransferase n=1 Tax=Maridesulfovibrio zosterae TaxID=82171 RepID=UPI0004088B29|nr:GNAT family N-acetyltransferase [Maridesulfovibrio zosterae]
MLKHDKWISEKLGVECYKLTSVAELMDSKTILQQLNEYGFIYGLTATDDVEELHFLEKHGFNLVDTRISFEKKAVKKIDSIPNELILRHALPADEDEVCAIAQKNFLYTRFHLDPLIPNSIANEIKREWIANYFRNKRGDDMLIAEKNGKVAGFLSIIHDSDNKKAIIDLVCVSKAFQKQGIGQSLLSYFENEYLGHTLNVGTQIANIASMRCYSAADFMPFETKYIVHRHADRS